MGNRLQFEGPDNLIFDSPVSAVFEVNRETRTIKGLAVPYGVTAPSGGQSWQFGQGSLQWGDPSRVKLLVGHDFSQAIGYATELTDTPQGLTAAFKVARGPEGDKALTMAEDKVWDGLSVGLGQDVKATRKDNVNHVTSASLAEISMTPMPSFTDARITSVAASAVPSKENRMKCDKCGQIHAANITECDPTEVAKFTAEKDRGPEFEAITQAVTDGIKAGFSAIADEPRPVVPAGSPVAPAFVSEPVPYRFDGTRGQHDFSADLIAAMGIGADKQVDAEAYQRVIAFMGEALGPKFVTTTNTAAVNPTGYRADMFVGYQKYTTPLRDAFFKGTLTDVTPFSFSKFNTSSGLVGDHTQGTEPTAGTFTTATGATITPAPVSGKVHITREVADQGGNPQVSKMIWDKIQYDYMQAMETKAATLLSGASPSELGAAIAAAANTVATLAVPVEQAIAGLNFVAGGNRYDYVAAHLDFYLALAGLKDGQSRPYFPIINPMNANGSTNAGYKSLNVAGTQVDPVWSLGTVSDGTPHKSYVIDTSVVWFWHSAPTRLDRLMEDVEGYDLGVWGYWAGVISDATGLKKITYDPV
jgi:HK97 family phage prohead protease